MTTTPTWYEALEFAARHQSSDWPEHCQQIVKMARAALAQKDHERLLPVGEVVCIDEPTNEEESGPVAVVQLYGSVQLGDRLYAAPQQAEAVHHKPVRVCHIKDVACSEAAVKCGECPDAAPQQAEAVPSDVVRDAAPIPDHELVTMYGERPTSDLEMIEFAREVERRHGIGGQPQHITDGSPCWCNPDVAYTDPETGASVIVHRRPQ